MSQFISGLSVIVPFYNESGNIMSLIKEISQTLEHIPFEILAIDDASTDETFQELEQAAKLYPKVKIFRHDRNYGQSPAILTGAYQAQYPLLVTLDGDGQNNPQDIVKLWETYHSISPREQKATVVFGKREKRHDNLIRRFSSLVGNTTRSLLLKDQCPDTGCSLKLFPRDGFLQLPLFNHFHRYLPALFQLHNYQIIYVNVSHRPRLRGKSKYGIWNRLWVGIYDLFGVRWLLRRKCYPQLTKNP
jgi:dolichol-phosphate mannosyltransferase